MVYVNPCCPASEREHYISNKKQIIKENLCTVIFHRIILFFYFVIWQSWIHVFHFTRFLCATFTLSHMRIQPTNGWECNKLLSMNISILASKLESWDSAQPRTLAEKHATSPCPRGWAKEQGKQFRYKNVYQSSYKLNETEITRNWWVTGSILLWNELSYHYE